VATVVTQLSGLSLVDIRDAAEAKAATPRSRKPWRTEKMPVAAESTGACYYMFQTSRLFKITVIYFNAFSFCGKTVRYERKMSRYKSYIYAVFRQCAHWYGCLIEFFAQKILDRMCIGTVFR